MENILFIILAFVCLIYALNCRMHESDAKRQAKSYQKGYDCACKGISEVYRSLSKEEQKKLRDLVQRKVFDDDGDDTVVYPLKLNGKDSRKISEIQKQAEERLIWKEIYRHMISKDVL